MPIQIWITALVACLSVTMSTSAVDNYQNALADNISGVYLKNYSVWYTRALVLCLNVPCIVVSLRVSIPAFITAFLHSSHPMSYSMIL